MIISDGEAPNFDSVSAVPDSRVVVWRMRQRKIVQIWDLLSQRPIDRAAVLAEIERARSY